MIVKETPHYQDVLLIGAGISGINLGYHLQTQLPDLSYTILENRDAIGGTWDLFKFPGIRSDSDLYTFGFAWRPWTEQKSIAEGPLIVKYVKESAAMYNIDKKILFRHKVASANWSSEERTWSLAIDNDGVRKVFTCRFLVFCTGYYDYETPLQTTIPGIDNFKGDVLHPQFWPQDLDYTGKKIVIIGSGATAITLLPALAKKAAQVTMLQRSPSFVVSQPAEDGLEIAIRKTFPVWMARKMIRLKWLIIPWMFINFCRYLPNAATNLLSKAASKQLPESIKQDPHFKPRYNPFEQRVCFCPDGDFYAALRKGKADVVTDTISTVTASSIKLASGQELNPDIIVTATGLKLRMLGGIPVYVDDKPYTPADNYVWKSCMLQNLPNAAWVVGYVDASWTLGADATSHLLCRMFKKMQGEGTTVATPRLNAAEQSKMKDLPVLRLTSTYVKVGGKNVLPKAGDGAQWRPRSTYFRDWWESRFGDLASNMEYLKA